MGLAFFGMAHCARIDRLADALNFDTVAENDEVLMESDGTPAERSLRITSVDPPAHIVLLKVLNSTGSESCLAVDGTFVPGAQVKAADCTKADTQLWYHIIRDFHMGWDNPYFSATIQIGKEENLCLDQHAQTKAVTLEKCVAGKKEQRWAFKPHSYYNQFGSQMLKNMKSGLCFGVYGGKHGSVGKCAIKNAEQAIQLCDSPLKIGCDPDFVPLSAANAQARAANGGYGSYGGYNSPSPSSYDNGGYSSYDGGGAYSSYD